MNTNTQNQVPPLPEHARERLQAKVREVFGTPRPWQAINTEGAFSEIYIEPGNDRGWDPNDDPIAVLRPSTEDDRPQVLANAQLIVRAVNAHEDLLEACKVACEYLSKVQAFGDSIGSEVSKPQLGVAHNLLRQAIRKSGAP